MTIQYNKWQYDDKNPELNMKCWKYRKFLIKQGRFKYNFRAIKKLV